jgi:hypothetical protein
MLQYSAVGISDAIVDITTIQCELYCKHGAKYSAHSPVYAMWTMVPDIYNAFTAPYIQTSIFIWTYLLCYCTYHDNSMLVILQTCCQIQRTSYQFTLCELWPWPYTKYLQLLIVRPQYSSERICAAIRDIPTHRCALYCKFGDKYSAYPPVYAVWSVVPDIYKVFNAPHIYASIFSWRYLRCYWRDLDNSMCVILEAWCQIQRTFSSLRYLNCGPGHIQCTYSSTYSGCNIQLNTSALLLEIYRQFNVRYTANIVPYTAHILQFALSELWSRTYTMYLQLLIVRPQYSTERICAAIGDIPTLRCALCCKFGVKYSAYRPVYVVWSVVPDIYKVFNSPHI